MGEPDRAPRTEAPDADEPTEQRQTTSHAIRRARERYGLGLTVWDLRDLASDIQENRAVLLDRQKDGSTAWMLPCKGVMVRVVIDRTFYFIKTFLPATGPVSKAVVRGHRPGPPRPVGGYFKGKHVWKYKKTDR